jgi:hypothetical protein
MIERWGDRGIRRNINNKHQINSNEPNSNRLLKARGTVTPAKAGVQNGLKELDSCFRRNDNERPENEFTSNVVNLKQNRFDHCQLEFWNYLGFGICNLEFRSQLIIERC